MNRRGYADSQDRVPPGWKVVSQETWPVNNPGPERRAPLDLEKWRFRTCGEVDNPLELSYSEFQALPHVSKTLDHHCIDGWSYLGQSWNGVDISVIREATKVHSAVKYMIIEGERIASQRFPIGQDLLVADGQDGAKLIKTVGYPLRILAPGEFGYRSRKWIDTIRFCVEMEQDDLERGFQKAGVYEVYQTCIRSATPWTVDQEARKKFLLAVFADEVEGVRQARRRENLTGDRTTHQVSPSADEDEVRLCSVESLIHSSPVHRLTVNGSEILLTRCGDEVHAMEPLCSHAGTDLTHGRINSAARTIKCPLHGALFDIATGSCLSGSYGADADVFPPIRKYRIRVAAGDVFLQRKQDWDNLW